MVPDKSAIGKIFKQDAKLITSYLEKLTEEEVAAIEAKLQSAEPNGQISLQVEDKTFSIKTEHLKCKRYQKLIHGGLYGVKILSNIFLILHLN